MRPAGPDTLTNPTAYAHADSYANPYAGTNTYAIAHANSHSGTHTDSQSIANTYAHAGSDADPHTGAYPHSVADAYAGRELGDRLEPHPPIHHSHQGIDDRSGNGPEPDQ